MAKWLIEDMRPLRAVVTKPFKYFMSTVNPEFKSASFQKIHQIISTEKEALKIKVKDAIQSVDSFTVSFDGWADIHSEAFIGILGYFRFVCYFSLLIRN